VYNRKQVINIELWGREKYSEPG